VDEEKFLLPLSICIRRVLGDDDDGKEKETEEIEETERETGSDSERSEDGMKHQKRLSQLSFDETMNARDIASKQMMRQLKKVPPILLKFVFLDAVDVCVEDWWKDKLKKFDGEGREPAELARTDSVLRMDAIHGLCGSNPFSNIISMTIGGVVGGDAKEESKAEMPVVARDLSIRPWIRGKRGDVAIPAVSGTYSAMFRLEMNHPRPSSILLLSSDPIILNTHRTATMPVMDDIDAFSEEMGMFAVKTVEGRADMQHITEAEPYVLFRYDMTIPSSSDGEVDDADGHAGGDDDTQTSGAGGVDYSFEMERAEAKRKKRDEEGGEDIAIQLVSNDDSFLNAVSLHLVDQDSGRELRRSVADGLYTRLAKSRSGDPSHCTLIGILPYGFMQREDESSSSSAVPFRMMLFHSPSITPTITEVKGSSGRTVDGSYLPNDDAELFQYLVAPAADARFTCIVTISDPESKAFFEVRDLDGDELVGTVGSGTITLPDVGFSAVKAGKATETMGYTLRCRIVKRPPDIARTRRQVREYEELRQSVAEADEMPPCPYRYVPSPHTHTSFAFNYHTCIHAYIHAYTLSYHFLSFWGSNRDVRYTLTLVGTHDKFTMSSNSTWEESRNALKRMCCIQFSPTLAFPSSCVHLFQIHV
jgi:hypothetical protein